ncbi:hypothetical protein DNTS_029352 [Danionella cerebrum]|uniref:CMP/dCMP-type deaminase domain-containing protein n=1 Tax=Danionella cerebrum TaxID=2873325 RepID=A0A553Q7U9_9TELE|nr:hypothetical protein DNTS_029352 [Danionella translucida]
MAERKSSASNPRLSVRRKERVENDSKKEEKSVKEEVNGKEVPAENGDTAAAAPAANGEKPEPIELPPFEIITGQGDGHRLLMEPAEGTVDDTGVQLLQRGEVSDYQNELWNTTDAPASCAVPHVQPLVPPLQGCGDPNVPPEVLVAATEVPRILNVEIERRITKERIAEGSIIAEPPYAGADSALVSQLFRHIARVRELLIPQIQVPLAADSRPSGCVYGDRIDPFFYKFQFKNVEYSSGRNKTFLCYLVDTGADGLLRGYIEDEHASSHAEEAFFMHVLASYDANIQYVITWYVSSSPCAACAAKLTEMLKARKNIRLAIFSARLFEWEEPEIRAALHALAAAGCKLRMMKPLDFSYTWDTFVESDDQPFTPWEDCQENYEYYQDKLAEILQ